MKQRKQFANLILMFILVLAFQSVFCQSGNKEEYYQVQKNRLLKILESEGINDPAVLAAMQKVPRHAFVPESHRDESYVNHPLPIGEGQTISQPYIVAFMCQALDLKPEDKILEIGTGSGYHAAVMSQIVNEVYTIEIIESLGKGAEKILDSLNYENITVRIGDGYKGWEEQAPFDKIILTAAPPKIPNPLKEQLKVGGKLIAPVGVAWQSLILLEKRESGFNRKDLIPVAFVPMTGEAQK